MSIMYACVRGGSRRGCFRVAACAAAVGGGSPRAAANCAKLDRPQVLLRVVELTRKTAARVEAVGPGGEVDVADAAKRVTSDVMGTLLFGEDLGGVDGKPSEYMDLFNQARRIQLFVYIRITIPVSVFILYSLQLSVQYRYHHNPACTQRATLSPHPPPPTPPGAGGDAPAVHQPAAPAHGALGQAGGRAWAGAGAARDRPRCTRLMALHARLMA